MLIQKRMLWGLGMMSLLACIETGKESDTATTPIEAEPTYCEQLDLKEVGFDPSGATGDFGELAPDFTLNLLDGSAWSFSENWTGCDNFLFVNYYSASNYPVALDNSREIKELLELAPRNTHIFILAYPASQTEDMSTLMTGLSTTFSEGMSQLDAEQAAWWTEHVHFVLDDGWSADWVGTLNGQYYAPNEFVLWSFAIDRQQRVREVGNYCDPSTGWEQCPPFFLAYESIYFNFESQRESELEAMGGIAVTLFDQELVSDPGWAGARSEVTLELPDAATMATYDTLYLDLELECTGYPAGTQCPAWDYIVNGYLCEIDDASTEEDESTICTKELGRWITTYWRPGRWVHDATPMLAWLKDGGSRKFQFYSQQPYNTTLKLRLSNQEKGYRPVEIQEVFRGGALDNFYNWGMNHEISETLWTQSTIAEEVDSYAISEWGNLGESQVIRIEGSKIIFVGERDDEFEVIGHDEQNQFFVTFSSGGNQRYPNAFQRMDYAWTGNENYPLALCVSTWDGEDAMIAEAASENCLLDDPTSCTPKADASNWFTGCNFGAWQLLSNDGDVSDILGDWEDSNQQQFAVAQNGADNAKYANKYSRWDWTVANDQVYFCHTEDRSTTADGLNAWMENCQSDNANTAIDESVNCTSVANPKDLSHGCDGAAWRQMPINTTMTDLPLGVFQEIWHEDKLPQSFTPPQGTTKVEVAGVISGHGFGADSLNCAEFCDHQHQFWANNGTAHRKTHPEAGSLMGCADQVAVGTIPNQSGTWIYGRGGWCPGLEVPVWRADITEDVNFNADNTLNYLGLVDGVIYHPNYTSGDFRPRVDMRSYVVFYQ